MKSTSCLFWVVWWVSVLYGCAISQAAVFSVERDGTGDFSIIQDAVDAAASGDTIHIGPGRYDEGQILDTPGWAGFVRVVAEQNELTIIGSGSDQTIIGPEGPYQYSLGESMGLIASPFLGCEKVNIIGIGFEGMRAGVSGSPASAITLAQCRFSKNEKGIGVTNGLSLEVDNCSFSQVAEDGKCILTIGIENVDVRGSRFELAGHQNNLQIGALFQSANSVEVSGCQFVDGLYGLKIVGTMTGTVSGCTFYNQERRSVSFEHSNVLLSDSFLEDQNEAIFLVGYGSRYQIRNTSICDVTRGSIILEPYLNVQVNKCILGKGEVFTIIETVDKIQVDPNGLDLRYNDWGTTEEDSIAAWIYAPSYDVEFVPFVGGPVSTQEMSLDEVKALYR